MNLISTSSKKNTRKPLDIERLYEVASLILLPSQTEGRGLPIIEAAACGTPIFCKQYEPRAVYEQVIGYHLDESQRLKVLEFKGYNIPRKLIAEISDHVFYPQNSMEDLVHNRNVIQQRYSLEALQRNMEYLLRRLHSQLNAISDTANSRVVELLKNIRRWSTLKMKI